MPNAHLDPVIKDTEKRGGRFGPRFFCCWVARVLLWGRSCSCWGLSTFSPKMAIKLDSFIGTLWVGFLDAKAGFIRSNCWIF